MMEYKGYTGHVEFDDEAELFHGEVLDTRDVITFQGRSVEELKIAFRDSIEDYLAFCKELGEEPEKPFSGQFVTRMSPELHREVKFAAFAARKSINAWVVEQLQAAVAKAGFSRSEPTAPRRSKPAAPKAKKGKRTPAVVPTARRKVKSRVSRAARSRRPQG